MTLDEAIAHCDEVAKEKDKLAAECECESHPTLSYRANECRKCAEEHRQLAGWLSELKRLKEGGDYYRCWFCGGELIWSADFNYDEVFGEGEGIVAYLTCADCGAEAQFSLRTDEEV